MKFSVPFAVVLFAATAAFAQADLAPGTKLKVDPAALAQPNATPNMRHNSKPVPRGAATLKLPPGFTATIFAENLGNPRKLKVMANGDVLVAETNGGKITLLRDTDKDGKADLAQTFVDGFALPHGMVVDKDALLVADQEGIWRIPYKVGDSKASAKPVLISSEHAFGKPGGHYTRNLALSADGKKIYASVGSSGNLAEDPAPRATVQVFDLNADATKATNQRTFASGLRNPSGIGINPATQDVFVAVNERDTLGDELVPDYFTKVSDGAFFGWPYSYTGKNPQPGFADKRPDLVAKALTPDVLFRSHSAPLGFTFATGKQFPKEYQGGAFVALHGSWNAAVPRGYMLAYVPFANGKPTGEYDVFASGFWVEGADEAGVIGRPVDVAVANDGSLLVSDDVGKVVWRISYTGK